MFLQNMRLIIIWGIFHFSCFLVNNAQSEDTVNSVSVGRGRSVLLKCGAQSNNKAVKYRWLLNGRIIEPSSRRSLIDGNLLIKHVDEVRDEGEYICEIQDSISGEKLSSTTILVRVNWLDSNVSVVLLHPEHVFQIDTVRQIELKCMVNGSAKIKTDWLRNGERITKSERAVLNDNKLLIRSLTSSDNGVYRCTATNEAGTITSQKNFALALPSDSWATIRIIPEDKIVKERTAARFDCVYQNADILEWYFQEKGPLENSTRHTILSNGSLIVNSATEIDEGLYACVGIKQESTSVPSKYTAILSIAFLKETNASYLEPSESLSHVVAERKTFEIKCIPPVGRPTPTTEWFSPSGKIVGNSGRVKSVDGTLIVNEANPRDSGSYTCKAKNLAGFRQVTFNLTVVVPPVIDENFFSKEVDEGTDITLRCTFTGTPHPFTQISWYKDDLALPSNTTRIFLDMHDGTLYLANVEVSDSGNYSCVLSTAFFHPVKSKIAAVIVKQKLKFHPLPMGKKMELGMPNKIPCKAEGKDVPAVKWIKGNSTKDAAPFPQHIQDVNGTLHFMKVQQGDKGKYTCVATNSQGEISITVDVDVVVTPKFTILPKNPTEGFEGSPIQLDCAAEGDPAPTIQWDNKMIDFTQKRFHVFSNGSLLIEVLHLGDEGQYGCTAGNSGGFNRTEVTLIVRNADNFKPEGAFDGIEGDTVGKTIIITLGAAFAYIFLVVILMAWCRYRRRRKKQSYIDPNADDCNSDEDAANGDCNLRNPVELKETVSVQNGEPLFNDDEDGELMNTQKQPFEHSLRLSNGYETSSFSQKDIHNTMFLGKGEFGSVYLAQNHKNGNAVVMVKVLEEINEEFKRQLNILNHVKHDHFVKLIGLCEEAKPPYMILEYTDWGDLKQFLIATRKSSVGVIGNKERPAPLTLKQSLSLAKQVASALEYLANLNYTHRDVAARNCLITSSLNVKITFSSLCKTTYAAEYYPVRNQFLPIRWLPLEAVTEDNFSTETEVYSFACLVWEVFAKGELPFGKLSNKEFLSLLEKRQLRWKLPKSIPPLLESLLHQCWSLTPCERPTFSQVSVELTQLMNLVDKE